jgi:hypothetical protein
MGASVLTESWFDNKERVNMYMHGPGAKKVWS